MALVIPIILTQCSDKDLSEIIVSDAIMYVPIEGSPMTAGYLTVTNMSDVSVDIEGINCDSIMAEIHYDYQVEKVLNDFYLRGLINDKEKKSFLASINRIVNDPLLQDLFSINLEVLNEREVVLNDKSILKPDRVVFHDSGLISIIDYKTGEEMNKHKTQLREYASSMEELGLKVKNLFLVYTLSTHKVVKV